MDFEIEGKTLEWIWRKTSLKRVFRVFHCVLFFQLSENYSNSLTSSSMLNMFPFQFFSFIFITFWIDKLAPFLRRVDANTVDALIVGRWKRNDVTLIEVVKGCFRTSRGGELASNRARHHSNEEGSCSKNVSVWESSWTVFTFLFYIISQRVDLHSAPPRRKTITHCTHTHTHRAVHGSTEQFSQGRRRSRGRAQASGYPQYSSLFVILMNVCIVEATSIFFFSSFLYFYTVRISTFLCVHTI